MKDLEVFGKAINIAIANGWDMFGFLSKFKKFYSHYYLEDGYLVIVDKDHIDWQRSFNDVAYHHDFAKALWKGNIKYCPVCRSEYNHGYKDPDPLCDHEIMMMGDAWNYHLQQMVISDDPIRYLGENI